MKKKINWLLILQGWAMLWVVIGHSFIGNYKEGPEWETLLCNIAYSFHMPLFMLVSGWLFYMTRLKAYALISYRRGGQLSVNSAELKGNSWTYSRIIKDKSLRLLLPGLVFSIVALVLKVAFSGEMARQVGLSVNDVVHSYLYPYDNPMRELWFIATLFAFFLFTPLWKWLVDNKWLEWGGIVALLVLHFIHPETTLLCIDRICRFAIWFYFGLVISKENLVDEYMAKKPWLTFIIGVMIYVIGRYTDPSITTFGGIVFSFGLAILLDKYIPKTFFTFRNYTYQIFLMGIFAQIFVKIMYKHISIPYVAAYLLCILMGLYVPVLVSKLIEKINWKPLSLCVGLKTIKK